MQKDNHVQIALIFQSADSIYSNTDFLWYENPDISASQTPLLSFIFPYIEIYTMERKVLL